MSGRRSTPQSVLDVNRSTMVRKEIPKGPSCEGACHGGKLGVNWSREDKDSLETVENRSKGYVPSPLSPRFTTLWHPPHKKLLVACRRIHLASGEDARRFREFACRRTHREVTLSADSCRKMRVDRGLAVPEAGRRKAERIFSIVLSTSPRVVDGPQ